ncbi:hypothetical protein [Burkholderia sp. LMG 32019]|uniref:hypothetical protein n=1 Tax=Burkholderia sp. LMG 32019 TaxID=3158173 RepID=UPI003C2CC277
MTTLSMQTVIYGKTIQVALLTDTGTASIFVMDNDDGSRQPRVMKVRQPLDAGMTDAGVVRQVLNIVVASIERRGQPWAH